MPKPLDLAGVRFGRLVALAHVGYNRHQQRLWECACDCGNKTVVSLTNLRKLMTQSCGCLKLERARAANLTHGMTGTRAWKAWTGMRDRCLRRRSNWKWYGGKGISVCERWNSFQNFYDDMGEPAPGLTLDRIDPNGDYEPGNCRWATVAEQHRNTTRNVFLTYQGRTQVAADWARELGISARLIYRRVKDGWPPERVLAVPPARRPVDAA